MPKQPSWLSYAFLAGAAFLAALLLIGLMFWRADALVRLGLDGRLYYLVLVPLGLAVAAFLFGCLKSYATYKGQVLGGALELSGPVVAFLLVLILGFLLPGPTRSFDVTVYAETDDAPARPLVQGRVLLQLDGDPREAALSGKGEAYFNGIPAPFRGQAVVARLLDAPGWEAAQDTLTLQAGGVTLKVRGQPAVFRGYVRAEDGQPVAGARLSLAGLSVLSDASGHFHLALPRAQVVVGMSIHAQAAGFTPWSSEVVAEGAEIQAVLRRPSTERP